MTEYAKSKPYSGPTSHPKTKLFISHKISYRKAIYHYVKFEFIKWSKKVGYRC